MKGVEKGGVKGVRCRSAKSRDRCDCQLRETFKFWGNLGKSSISQLGKFLIYPFNGKYLFSPSGEFFIN